MLTPTKTWPIMHSYPFRWMARTSAAVLIVIWLALFITEAMRPGFGDLSASTIGQAASLAIVFVGYVVGVRRELAGGIAAIIGTLAFYLLVLATTEEVPGVAALLLAIPGVLYLLAWHYDERRRLRL